MTTSPLTPGAAGTPDSRPIDWEAWQQRWDRQQEGYLEAREQRLEAMLDVVVAVAGAAPVVLDLAGGTGSISRRLLARCPQARTVLLDVDPALLAVARGSFGADRRVTVCDADLRDDAWPDLARAAADLGDRPFDAVLSATALHWLTPSRLHTLYGQATGLLRDGGVLANADHMADSGLSVLAERIAGVEADRSEARRRASGADDWDTWWQHLAAEPDMKDLLRQREERFAGHGGSEHTESDQPVEWHLDALRAAGLGAVGVVWRHLGDAVVLGVRTSTA